MNSNPIHGKVYSIQHYVIKFVSDLGQVGGFPGTPDSSINKTDRHEITKILLNVALNTINLNQTYKFYDGQASYWIYYKQTWYVCQHFLYGLYRSQELMGSTPKIFNFPFKSDLDNFSVDSLCNFLHDILKHIWPSSNGFWNKVSKRPTPKIIQVLFVWSFIFQIKKILSDVFQQIFYSFYLFRDMRGPKWTNAQFIIVLF